MRPQLEQITSILQITQPYRSHLHKVQHSIKRKCQLQDADYQFNEQHEYKEKRQMSTSKLKT